MAYYAKKLQNLSPRIVRSALPHGTTLGTLLNSNYAADFVGGAIPVRRTFPNNGIIATPYGLGFDVRFDSITYSVPTWSQTLSVEIIAWYRGGTTIVLSSFGDQGKVWFDASGKPAVSYYGGSSLTTVSAANAAVSGQLYHIMLTQSPTNGLSLYVNGVFEGNAACPSPGTQPNFSVGESNGGNHEAVLFALVANGVEWSAADVYQRFFNTYGFLAERETPFSSPVGAYTLTADTGAFVLTGNAVNLKRAVTLTAGTGAFTLTGNAANLKRTLAAGTGAFVLTGNAALLSSTADKRLTADTGAFNLTGNPVSFASGGSRTMAAGIGAFALTGNAVNLTLRTLSLTQIANYRVFQTAYGSDYVGNPPLQHAGAYAGPAPSTLEMKVDVDGGGNHMPYADMIGYVPSAGAFTAEYAVLKGPWLKRTVRDKTLLTASPQDTNKFGVGLNIMFHGQSNAGNMLDWPGQTAPFWPGVDPYTASFYDRGGGGGISWALWTPSDVAGRNQGRGFSDLAASLRTRFGDNRAIGGMGANPGGTAINPAFLPPSGTAYTGAKALIDHANGDKCRFLIWWQGEANCGNPGHPTTYGADLLTVVNGWVALMNRADFKFLIVQLGTVTGVNIVDDECDTMRALLFAQSQQANCAFAASAMDCNGYLHYDNGPDGYGRIGLRMANAVAFEMGLSPYPSLGPRIASAVWPVGSTQCTISTTHSGGGTGLRMADGGSVPANPVALIVKDNGTPVTASATSFVGTNIVMTMPSTRSAGHTVTVQYAMGGDPFNQLGLGYSKSKYITDNNQIGGGGGLANYLGDTSGLGLMPTSAGAIEARENAGTASYLTYARRRGRR